MYSVFRKNWFDIQLIINFNSMKKYLSIVVLFYLFTINSTAQFNYVKAFDYNLLKKKVLYIPKLSEDSRYAKKYIKTGNYSKLKTFQEKVEYFNQIWTEAMAISSYDATPYEIKEFEYKKIFKEKNEEAIILLFITDKYNNEFAQLWIAAPKRQCISSTIINGLDLADPKDIRLMINMLNYSLNEYAEIENTTKDKSFSGINNKYKEIVVDFYNNLPGKTFYVIKEEDPKKPDKAAERNKELEEALKEKWNLCNYQPISESDFEKIKETGDTNGFYWKSFNVYTQSILMTYKLRYLLTVDRDEVLFEYYNMGSSSLKAATIEDLQEKIIKKGEKYKKGMNK